MFPDVALSLIAVALASGPALEAEPAAAPDPTFPASDITVDEQLGASVPLDVPLRDHTGNDTTLGELLAGDLPTILTFNYSSCPNLCNVQLAGLVDALPGVVWRVGQQFRIVTIVLDPDEPLDRIGTTRTRWVGRLPAGSRAPGWTFATTRTPGDGAPIKRIADAVGFHYRFITERAEYAHPAALIFVSPAGRVIRYVYGVGYDKDTLTSSISRAGTDEPTAAAGFLLRCFHFDPGANDYSKVGALALRYAAAGFLVLVLSGFGIWQLVRRHRRLSSPRLGDRP